MGEDIREGSGTVGELDERIALVVVVGEECLERSASGDRRR